MLVGNASKRPQEGEQTPRTLTSHRRLDTSMPQCAINVASDPGNSELP